MPITDIGQAVISPDETGPTTPGSAARQVAAKRDSVAFRALLIDVHRVPAAIRQWCSEDESDEDAPLGVVLSDRHVAGRAVDLLDGHAVGAASESSTELLPSRDTRSVVPR